MADLRIVDAPEIPTENITGEEKLPTGGNGNYSISLDSLADYTKTKKDLADNTSVDGKVNGVRQELDAHIEDLLNPHQVTKGQIGLGNVDNTADADKPVSNSAQAAIISAVAPKADKTYVDTALSSKTDKTYVDNQLALKANKADVYTKQESSDLVNNSISTALTPINTSLDLAKRGIANRYDSALTYNSGERVVLTNGDIVKSTIDGNTNNPSVDITGWVKTNSASQIFDENGLNQQEWNNGVESIADLLAIPNPKNGSRVFVRSYYAGLNSGGGDFIFKSGSPETEVSGFVINVSGGVWSRVLQNVHSIDDAGAHPTKSSTVNANAINSILGFVKNVQVPNADYSVDPDIIKINNRNVLFGNGRLIGTAPDTLGIADGTGIYIHANETDTAIIRGIKLKNGYKSNGIFLRKAKNILIDDVTVDGMSYAITAAEKDFNVPNSGGCENIIIQNPKILNTRYWGIYLRGANITTESLKTQNIKVLNPYFYNCNMAGFVASEGNVKNFVLENPVFNRCNVCMHFEHASEFTVINARDFDTGKKPDHVQANTEYPFVNWSMYHAFSRKAKIVDCTLSATVSHLAGTAADVRVYDIEYSNTKAYTFTFEGVGASDSTNKHAFQNISWDRCASEREFIYHQALDEARSWLRDFSIVNSTCKLGINGNSGNGSYAAIASPRAKNMRIDNNTIHNATLRIACENNLFVTNNTWIDGTDNTELVIEGLRGGLYGDFCEFTGNMFERAGGAVQGDSGVRMSSFTRIRADNVVRGTGAGYAYRFSNNYRIELGAGFIYDFPLGTYVETGTGSAIVRLYAP